MKGNFRIGFKRKALPSLFRGIVDFAKEDRDSFCMNRKTESGKEANESEIARLTAEVEKLKGQIKCSNEKNNEQWKKLQE